MLRGQVNSAMSEPQALKETPPADSRTYYKGKLVVANAAKDWEKVHLAVAFTDSEEASVHCAVRVPHLACR